MNSNSNIPILCNHKKPPNLFNGAGLCMIPRRIKTSGHFGLKTPVCHGFNQNLFLGN